MWHVIGPRCGATLPLSVKSCPRYASMWRSCIHALMPKKKISLEFPKYDAFIPLCFYKCSSFYSKCNSCICQTLEWAHVFKLGSVASLLWRVSQISQTFLCAHIILWSCFCCNNSLWWFSPLTVPLLLLLLSHFSRVRLCATPSLGFSRQERTLEWVAISFNA